MVFLTYDLLPKKERLVFTTQNIPIEYNNLLGKHICFRLFIPGIDLFPFYTLIWYCYMVSRRHWKQPLYARKINSEES